MKQMSMEVDLSKKNSKFFPWILQFGGSTSVILLKIKRAKHL